MNEYIEQVAQLNEIKIEDVSLDDQSIIAGLIFLYAITHEISTESMAAFFSIPQGKIKEVIDNLIRCGWIKDNRIMVSNKVDYREQFLLFSMAGTGNLKVRYE